MDWTYKLYYRLTTYWTNLILIFVCHGLNFPTVERVIAHVLQSDVLVRGTHEAVNCSSYQVKGLIAASCWKNVQQLLGQCT